MSKKKYDNYEKTYYYEQKEKKEKKKRKLFKIFGN